MEVKDARAIHKEYLKNYPADSIVLNLKDLPNIEYCHIHEDGKGWGRYVKNGRAFNIGRNNGETNCLIYDRYDGKKWRNASKIKQVFVLHDNPEVVRTYTKFIKEGYWWGNVNIYQMQKINPFLFANLYDYMDAIRHNVNRFGTLINNLDQSTSSITKASGFSINYFKTLAIHGWYSRLHLQILIDLKFSPEECCNYISLISYRIPEKQRYDKRVLEKLYSLQETPDYNSYIDYLNMLGNLPTEIQKRFTICPSNIQKNHDAVMLLYSRQLAIREQERNRSINERYVKKVLPIVKKFEYEDDKYVMLAPKLVTDLITEGRVLSHCVGSYMNSVSNGNEYILFLRKKSDPDVPYFTVNITPGEHIRQIHGKCNCNVPPELIPFIEKWKNKFKITGDYTRILCHM